MFAKWWFWATVAVLLVVAFILGAPLTHSPRHDALEPHLRPLARFDDIRQVAEENHIPLELREEDERRVTYAVPLDGSKRGSTLVLTFRKDHGLWSAVTVDRSGKIVRQYFCILW